MSDDLKEPTRLEGRCKVCGFGPTGCICDVIFQPEESSAALDLAHFAEIETALIHLADLERRASPGPWRQGNVGGSVVNSEPPESGSTAEARTRYTYGGNVIFEAARLADREFIVALREHAETLIRQARNWKKTFTEMDEVHRILGTDYNKNVPAAIQALKDRCNKLESKLQGFRFPPYSMTCQAHRCTHTRDNEPFVGNLCKPCYELVAKGNTDPLHPTFSTVGQWANRSLKAEVRAIDLEAEVEKLKSDNLIQEKKLQEKTVRSDMVGNLILQVSVLTGQRDRARRELLKQQEMLTKARDILFEVKPVES